jgi:hypothetical protein
MKKTIKISKLLNFNVEINVITKQLIKKIDIIIRFDSYLCLTFYIKYNMNLYNIYYNVKLNIKKKLDIMFLLLFILIINLF